MARSFSGCAALAKFYAFRSGRIDPANPTITPYHKVVTIHLSPALSSPGIPSGTADRETGTWRRMNDHEAQAAWRLFTLNWIPLGVMALTLALCLAFTRFSMKPEGVLLSLAAIGLYAGIAYYNAQTPHKRDPRAIFVLGSTAQLMLASFLMTPLTYVAAALDMPLQDANLAALDRALGID